MVFIDDNGGHIKRASEEGLRTIRFLTMEETVKELEQLLVEL
jgi:hypothetical protein